MSGRRPLAPGARAAAALALAVAVLSAHPALADAQLAERRYRAARDLERAGQADQARELYLQIADDDGGSRRADDALLALARIAWPESNADRLADLSHVTRDVLAARSSLATLRDRHPTGDAAPEGTWRLALTYLVPRADLYDVDEASALLTTLPVLYPGAPEVPHALALGASLHAAAGRTEQATSLAFRLLADHPDHVVAPRAWLVLGRVDAEAGRAPDALRAFGRASIDGRARDPATADAARDLATVLDRVTYAAGRGLPPWAPIPGGLAADMRFSDIAVRADGSLFAVSSRDEMLVMTDAAGAVTERRERPGLTAVALDAHARMWLATETSIVPPDGTPIVLGERSEAVSFAPAGAGRAWVVDGREKAVLLVGRGTGVLARAALPARATPVRVASAPRGGAWVLTERPAALVRVGADGKPRSSVDLEALAREPVDLDVDGLGHVYVLDAKAPAVVVLGRVGNVLARLPLPAGDQGIERPTAIAVDRSGGIAVADARTKRIAWLR